MKQFVIFGICLLVLGIGSIQYSFAQSEIINDVEFLQTGIIHTLQNQFNISNEMDIRELIDGKIIRISGQTVEGFPYITYSKILDNSIDTRGNVFINGEFVKLSFEKIQETEVINIPKDENISIVTQYTQRIFSEDYLEIDVKIYNKAQNILNDFNQNYGFVTDTEINIIILDEEDNEFYSSSGIVNDKGYFTTKFLLPENSPRQTLTATITAENENSKTSKILQIFVLGNQSDDGKAS